MSPSIERILSNPELVREIADRLKRGAAPPSALRPEALLAASDAVQSGRESLLSSQEEAIIRREGRPVYFIRNDQVEGVDGGFWSERLAGARPLLERAIPSVGRIDLARHPRLQFAGTGWLVAPDVIVTNRHVALEFSQGRDGAFEFEVDPFDQTVTPSLDLAHEHGVKRERSFKIVSVLHIEAGGSRPDVAVLKISGRDQDGKAAPRPITLADADPPEGTVVGVVGYAARDAARNDAVVMGNIFGEVYDVKRLHPGELLAPVRRALTHDCSTLGGNSGSVVLDFATGRAVGLHYAGYYEAQNFAVKASTLAEILHQLKILDSRTSPE